MTGNNSVCSGRRITGLLFFFLLRKLLAADGGNKNGDGGKLASDGGNIAGVAGKRKQRDANNGFPAVSGINP